jgi:hypothetical protein
MGVKTATAKQETAMSTDKKTETSKRQPATLIETTKKSDIELSEQDLARSAGGSWNFGRKDKV